MAIGSGGPAGEAGHSTAGNRGLAVALLLLIGVTIGSAWAARSFDAWLRDAAAPVQRSTDERAEATITDIGERDESLGCSAGACLSYDRYFPTVRFTTATGEEVEAESRCHDLRSPDEGDRVVVFHDRADRQDVCLADGFDSRRAGHRLGDLGVDALMVGAVGALAVFLGALAIHAFGAVRRGPGTDRPATGPTYDAALDRLAVGFVPAVAIGVVGHVVVVWVFGDWTPWLQYF